MSYAWAAPYIGIPFLDKGRDKAGCDCWGLARMVWAEVCGVHVPSFLEYEDANSPKEIGTLLADKKEELQTRGWKALEQGQEKPFDAILFRCLGETMHVALVAKKGEMLHTRTGTNSCIESYLSGRWKTRIVGFWRHESMEDKAHE
jgi:probable lipoprotein NlpC